MDLSPIQIAKVCHQANKALCELNGDMTQVDWDKAPEWQRESALSGVVFLQANPHAGPNGTHDNWMREKIESGWKYGPVKNSQELTHPCIQPFQDLPHEQQAKDILFLSVVRALSLSQEELQKILQYTADYQAEVENAVNQATSTVDEHLGPNIEDTGHVTQADAGLLEPGSQAPISGPSEPAADNVVAINGEQAS